MRALALLLLWLLALAPGAAADPQKDWDECAGEGAEQIIAACTRIVNRGKETQNDLASAYYNRGNGYREKGDFDRAIADYTKSLELLSDATTHNNRGLAYSDKGDYDEAIADFDEALRLDPQHALAPANRGYAYARKGEHKRAIEDYDRALAINSKDTWTLIQRGNAHGDLNDLDAALADYEAVIAIDATSSTAYNNRAWIWTQREDYDRALVDYGTALRLDGANFDALNGRGWVLLQKREFASALADLDQALRLKPDDVLALINRAWTYYERGEDEAALRDFEAAMRLDPDSPGPVSGRGWVRASLKNFAGAVADFDKAIALDPDDAGHFNGRCWALANKGDHGKAIADCDKAIAASPDEKAVWQNRGWAYTRKGDLALALADFDRAVSLDPESSSIYADRGYAFELKGERALALADYHKALSLRSKERYDDAMKSEVLQRISALATMPSARESAKTAARDGTKQGEPERRVALVIGNAAYRHAVALKNPIHDARAVAATLRLTGFEEVIEKYDLTLGGLAAELKAFGDRAAAADWAVVYYAGHGIEVGGVNYLIPVDAELKTLSHVEDEALPLDRVLSKVDPARKLRLVILDACRENPFARRARSTGGTRSIGRGLARVEPARGVMVAYAARDGQLAADGDTSNSPYARALVEHLSEPGLEINLLFRKVRDSVLAQTGGEQEPFTYGSLPAEAFYFRSSR